LRKHKKLLARALKINPEAPAVLNNIGSTYRSLKKYQLAIDSYSQAIALKPDYLEAILNKGNVYAELKDANSAYGVYIHG
jgi:tetratricopeptide (TPR) repeat protein